MLQNVVVKSSQKQGIGVFSLLSFKKNDVILQMQFDDVLSADDLGRLSDYEMNHVFYIGEGRYVRLKAPEKYLNHSCDPNAYMKEDRLMAMRDIGKNEEITIDYSMYWRDSWEMVCGCGSTNCRGTITEFKRLPPHVKQRYAPFLSGWFKVELENEQ